VTGTLKRIVEFYRRWLSTIIVFCLILFVVSIPGPDWIMWIAVAIVGPPYVWSIGFMVVTEWQRNLKKRRARNDAQS
jgi:hypothetical protein